MNFRKLGRRSPEFPASLKHIAGPPAQLFVSGTHLSELLGKPCVAIVGSRKVSPYGRQVTLALARDLAEQGIVIISGLALGVDALAHQAALEVDGLTIAVLPCSLDKLYPATNAHLGEQIVVRGGALVSEYDVGAAFSFKANFVARNRLIAGLAQAVIIPEAAEHSGSLHTAEFALQQGKDVLAVPGPITSPVSKGTNNLLKAGATLVTSAQDILEALGVVAHRPGAHKARGGNPLEQAILDLLAKGLTEGEELLRASGMPISEFSQTLTMLEIHGKIRPLGADNWALR